MSVIPFEKRSDLYKKIDLLEIELGRLLNADNQRKAASKFLLSDIEITNAAPMKYCRSCFVPMPITHPTSFCDTHQPKINLIDPMSVRGRLLAVAVLMFITVVFFGFLVTFYGIN